MELNFYFFPVQVAFGERSQVSKDFTRNIKIKRDDNQQLNLGLYKLLFFCSNLHQISAFLIPLLLHLNYSHLDSSHNNGRTKIILPRAE